MAAGVNESAACVAAVNESVPCVKVAEVPAVYPNINVVGFEAVALAFDTV